MTKAKLEMIKEFGYHVEKAFVSAVCSHVMAGAETLTPGTDGTDISLWMHAAINRLDAAVPEQERGGISENPGKSSYGLNGMQVRDQDLASL